MRPIYSDAEVLRPIYNDAEKNHPYSSLPMDQLARRALNGDWHLSNHFFLRALAVKGRTNAAPPLVDDVRLLEDLRGDGVLELHEAEPLALLAITNHFGIRHLTEGGEVLTQRLTGGRRVEPANEDLALRARQIGRAHV